MSQVVRAMRNTLAKSSIARLAFFNNRGQGLSPAASQPRHLQAKQR